MDIITHRILAATLGAPGGPRLTRDRVFELARQASGGAQATVHITVVDDPGAHFGEDVCVARVIVSNDSAAGSETWHLWYVTHPARCGGLTSGIEVRDADIENYFSAFKARSPDRPVTPSCVATEDAQGRGPWALLALDPCYASPSVPMQAHVALLERLSAR